MTEVTTYFSPNEVGQCPYDGGWYLLITYPELLTSRIDAAGGENSWKGKVIIEATKEGVLRRSGTFDYYTVTPELVEAYFDEQAYRQIIFIREFTPTPRLQTDPTPPHPDGGD